MFRGMYHGKNVHEDDLQDIIDRAVEAGCRKFMVTGSDLLESRHAVDLAREHCMHTPVAITYTASTCATGLTTVMQQDYAMLLSVYIHVPQSSLTLTLKDQRNIWPRSRPWHYRPRSQAMRLPLER